MAKKITEEITPRPKAKAWLVVQGGPQDGRTFPLRRRVITVGQDAQQADVVIPDATVSREHIRLKLRGDHFYLTDLASLNGVFVNDRRVNTCLLNDDDVIRLGNTTLVYKRVSPKAGL